MMGEIMFKKKFTTKGYWRFGDIGMMILSFLIIGVCIVIGIYLFYLNEIDVRSAEAALLAERVINGIIVDNHFNENVLADDFNLLDEARIDPVVISNGDFYIKIEIYKENSLKKELLYGNKNFGVLCGLEGETLPRCYSDRIIVDDYNIVIVTGVNHKK